ncbi:hypothetical protein F5Y17DRAFT_418115 [Xylariaceae sp. FL0594]|nr:hypothetical protein F5Y17DRAFT_418115 [Xylariaceae sp. FL0594]
MSGFEIVGVVLGSIPLVISALEHYEKAFKMYRRLRRREKEIHSLARSLSTEQSILRNTSETLLAGIVDPEDLQHLIADPFGPLWQAPHIQALVERRLDHTATSFRTLVLRMREEIAGMRLKLGVSHDSELELENKTVLKRNMVKIVMQFSDYQDGLKRLADMNQKLHMLMLGNLHNEPHRVSLKEYKVLNLLRAMSSTIYNAVKSSLSCNCADSHGMGFRLQWPTFFGKDSDSSVEALVKRLDFHLLLLNYTPYANRTNTWSWNELILRSLGDSEPVHPTTDVARRQGENHVMALTHSASKDQATESRTPGAVRSQRVNSHDINLQPLQRDKRLSQIKNICETMTRDISHNMTKEPYGYLLDGATQTKQRFEVFPFRSPHDQDKHTAIRLTDVFTQVQPPSLAQRYHIAATTAASILLTHETLWTPSILSRKSFYVIARQGVLDLDELYLANESLSDVNSSKATPPDQQEGILTLYYLSIFLVEVILWRPVYECFEHEGMDLRGVALEEIFDYTTTKGLARIESILKRIAWGISDDYKEIVKHCIKCDLSAPATLSGRRWLPAGHLQQDSLALAGG